MTGPATPARTLIGFFTAQRPPLEVVTRPRLRALAAEAAVQKSTFAVFSSEDIDLEGGFLRGYVLDDECWTDHVFPYPDVVINPHTPRTERDLEVEETLRRHAPFTTQRIDNKIGVAELMEGTPLQRHVIPYEPLDPDRAASQIGDFLDRHKNIVVKPAKGYRGQKITFLMTTEAGIQVRAHARSFVAPRDAVIRLLVDQMGEEPWLLQRFVLSRARGDRYFDVRVHIHKDGAGELAVVRAYVRLSEGGLMISNTSRGGYQGDIDHFFASLKEEGPVVVERLKRLGMAVVRLLDGHYDGGIDEMGVDFLVDGARHPWVAEVNSHPQSRYHEFDRARYVIAYARHLARRAAARPYP